MHLVIIVAICLAFSIEPARAGPVAHPWLVAGATLCGMLLAGLFAAATTMFITRRIRGDWGSRARILRLFGWLARAHTALLLGVFALTVGWLQWPNVVWANWQLHGWVLVGDLVVLAPFLVPLVWGWWAFSHVEQALCSEWAATGPPASAWSYLGFQVRHYLALILGPVLVFLALTEATDRWLPGVKEGGFWGLLWPVAAALLMVLGLPLMIRWLWASRPLGPGPLRARLEALSRRLRFRCTDILVWNTRGAMINAAVAGLVPWLRYILLSDGLIDEMTPEEIEAVFGHEIAHVKFRHLVFYVYFILGSLAAGLLIGTALQQSQPIAAWLTQESLVPWVAVGLYVWLVFGYVSRQFERQADLYGCRAISCGRADCPGHHRGQPALEGAAPRLCPLGIETFINALEKIASLSGIARNLPSWRHFSIARRVEFLRRALDQPAVEHRLQRSVLALKTAIVLMMIVAGGCLVFQVHSGRLSLASLLLDPLNQLWPMTLRVAEYLAHGDRILWHI